MDNYLVQLECSEQDAEVTKMRTFKLLISGESYTDAEAQAHKYYENNLKYEFSTPEIKKIGLEKIDRSADFLEADDDGQIDDVEYSKIFKAKVAIAYKENPLKPINKVVVARDFDIEVAIKKIQKYILNEYKADSCEVLEIKETDLTALCPFFDSGLRY